MKVLQITASSKGGGGIAAMRLQKALQESGVSSAYLSKNLSIDFDGNVLQDTFFIYKKPSFSKKVFLKIKKIFFVSKESKIASIIEEKKKLMEYEVLSFPYSAYQLERHPLVREADVLNFHWMGGILDYGTFFKNCKKPIVWTLHDMNPFLGLFHYKNDMLFNTKIIGKLDNEIQKEKFYNIEAGTVSAIITPSKWMLEEVVCHGFLPNVKKLLIPNAIDFSLFKKLDSNTIREEYNIESNEFVLLFVADLIKNKRKGFTLLLEALSLVNNIPITVIAVGKGEVSSLTNIKTISLKQVDSPLKMAQLYSLADVFVLPSLEDNLPNVMLESFACGTPVISFNLGGMSEHIQEGITGVLINEINANALAEGIIAFYKDRNKYNKDLIIEYAKDNFSFEMQASKYSNVYSQLNQLS